MINPKKIKEKIERIEVLNRQRGELFEQLMRWYNHKILGLMPVKRTKRVEYTAWVSKEEYLRLVRNNLV